MQVSIFRLHKIILLLIAILANNSFAQHKAILTDLNTNAELELKKEKFYYFQVVAQKKVYFSKLISVTDKSILFDSAQFSCNQISWISNAPFKNNLYNQWCRNNTSNWGLSKKPEFDLQQNILIEIVPDTTKLLLDSNRIESPKKTQLLKLWVPQVGYNLYKQATSPFRISGSQWSKTLLNLFVLGASSLTDQVIDDGIRKTYNSNSFPFRSSKYVSLLGSELGLGFTALWLGKGLVFNSTKSTETSLLAFQAALSATIWNRILKYTTLRERPYSAYENNHSSFNALGPSKLKDYLYNSDYHSFGSGHTTTAFAIATVFAEQYEDVPFVKVLCYTLASAVGISRMIQHKHWGSDVLMGAMIGYACGKQVTSFKQSFYKKSSKQLKLNTSISPFAYEKKVYPTLCIRICGN